MQICVVLECVSDVRIRHAFLTPTWTDVVSIRCFSNSGGRAVFERHSNTVHRVCQKSASLFFSNLLFDVECKADVANTDV